MLVAVSCTEDLRPEPAESAPSAGTIVECQNAIAHLDDVDDLGYTTIHGVVALETSESSPAALQVARNGDGTLFGKSGLVVRRNSRVELKVPEEIADEVSVRWGQSVDNNHLVIGPCDSGAEWLVFAGGYVVKRAGCFDLLVGNRSEQRTVTMGVGAPCPGQEPPPQLNASILDV